VAHGILWMNLIDVWEPSLELVVPIPNKTSSSTCVKGWKFSNLRFFGLQCTSHPASCSSVDSSKPSQLVGETHLVPLSITNLKHLFHLEDIYPQHELHNWHSNHATHRNIHFGLPPWGNVVPFYNIHSFEFCLTMDLLDGIITWNWRLLKLLSRHPSNIIKVWWKKGGLYDIEKVMGRPYLCISCFVDT